MLPAFTGVAVKVTVVPEQIVVAVAAMLTVTGNTGFTVMVTELEVAGLPVEQVALEVITQLTTCPLVRAALLNVAPVPDGVAPTYHWYAGEDPPLTGVAVKVTFVPAQIVVAGDAAILRLAGRFGLTITVIALETAGLPVGQVALEVSAQVTTSRFDKVVLVKIAPVATGLPFTYHW